MPSGNQSIGCSRTRRQSRLARACAAALWLHACAIQAAEFAGGAGTPADPYQIATAGQLVSIGADPGLLNKHFALVADIDLDPNLPSGQVFTGAVIAWDEDPYSGPAVAYTGRFYGHGHKISHLTVNGAGMQRVGLFGRIGSAGRVYDLALEDVRITAGDHAGALAGLNEGGLTNCSVTGRIRGSDQSSWLGGLAGTNTGSILGCRAEVAVTGGDGVLMLGLLAGMHRGGIVNCSAAGELVCGSDSLYLGGLAGACIGGVMRDSHASGRIVGGDRSWALGGLVGRMDSEGAMGNCYASNTITGGTGSHDLGGLVGTCFGVEIAHCYATGNVTGGTQSHNLGGLLGSCLGVAIRNAYATGDVSGFRRLGGFVGTVQTGTSIVNCHAVGRVLRGSLPSGRGGFAGYIERSPDVRVAGCFWNVEASQASASAAGVGLTAAQMQDARTFQTAGWDMAGDSADGVAELWLVPEGGRYPVLAALSDTYEPHALEGAGSSSDPYRIATAEDLGAMGRYSPSAWYRLVADIDLSGVAWSASPVSSFTGVFDGRGHRIRGLTLYGGTPERLGLFGRIEPTGWVFDLGLDEVEVVVPNDAAGVGALAGENAGHVLNCYVTGIVAGGDNCRNAGGLVGMNRLGIVADCYSVADVKTGPGGAQIGGLVGCNYMGTITNCYAAGRVRGDGESLGALAGHSSEHTATISSYYLATSAGGGPDRGAGSPVTVEQMTRQATFVDWDFKDTWTLCAGKGYPHLRWEGIECAP